MENYVVLIGVVKKTDLNKNFDKIYEETVDKAKKLGFKGKLKFKKRGGHVDIFVIK